MGNPFRRIKSWLGTRVHLGLEYYRVASGCRYDFGRYARYGIVGFRRLGLGAASSEALVIKEYHVIEKGLSMPEFRSRFGVPRVRRLVGLLEHHRQLVTSEPGIHFETAVRCLEAYRDRHAELEVNVDDVVDPTALARLKAACRQDVGVPEGGVRNISSEQLFDRRNAPFAEFARSRTSCRRFDPTQPVERRRVEAAVETSIRTPSVCNRQAWRVHSYHDRGAIDRLLEHQNGNRGFGHTIPCLLVVTVDLACFDGPIERYQPWIDGGMFGMMMLLSLHHEGLGAVPLNWSVMPTNDRRLRLAGGIPENESIIMLIGTGHPEGSFQVPVSRRRTLAEVHRFHQTV